MPVAIPESETWPDEVVQLLDDHHLVIVSDDAMAASLFTDVLDRRLRQLPETQVVMIDGARVRDVNSLCSQIERQIVSPASGQRDLQDDDWPCDVMDAIALLRGESGIVSTIRRGGASSPGSTALGHQGDPPWRDVGQRRYYKSGDDVDFTPPPKRRYFLWRDADAVGGLLRSDAMLFDRLVNALLGVAAEHEHILPDTLVLQRAVFLGREVLAEYAADPHSALNQWREEDGSPFWEVASVLHKPPVLRYRLQSSPRGDAR